MGNGTGTGTPESPGTKAWRGIKRSRAERLAAGQQCLREQNLRRKRLAQIQAHPSPVKRPARDRRLVESTQKKKNALVRRTGKSLTYAAHHLVGGQEAFINYCRAAAPTHPQVQEFLKHYDGITYRERRQFTLDTIAIHCGVPARALVEAVAGEAYEQGINVANLIAAEAFPDVVKASVDMATNPLGTEDRKMQMSHHGFLPMAKGTTVNVQQVTQVRGGADDFATPFEDTVRDLGEVSRQVERQPAIDAEVVDCTPEK